MNSDFLTSTEYAENNIEHNEILSFLLVNIVLDGMEKLLKDKFNKVNASGKKRDIGALGVKKPGLIEKIINKGTINAQRCIEIASGAKLTEKEINAKKRSEINPECPNIANPNFVPYN